jgi:hypothetical protein
MKDEHLLREMSTVRLQQVRDALIQACAASTDDGAWRRIYGHRLRAVEATLRARHVLDPGERRCGGDRRRRARRGAMPSVIALDNLDKVTTP